jgi:hypothetical protein
VYFKKDTGHKSDWEGIVVKFKNAGDNNWVRSSVIMEQGRCQLDALVHGDTDIHDVDGHHPEISWSDVNDTFDG